jgi:hypothetical protein
MSTLAAFVAPRAPGYAALHLVTHRTSSVSAETKSVCKTAWRVANFGERSFALFGPKLAAISEIWALVLESREAGVPSEEAEPIPSAAAELAIDFIRALPDDVPLPEFAWEPDGSISLDWMQSRHHVFSVSIGEGYRLPYAWLDGADRGHGVAFFDRETIPPRILEGIRRIVQHGDAAIRPT